MTGNELGTGSATPRFKNTALQINGNNNTIGGTGAGDANVIGDADSGVGTAPGVLVNGFGGASNNSIIGNFIGTDSGGSDRGNEYAGTRSQGPAAQNKVGGDTAAEENVISNSGTDAIEFAGSATPAGNLIARNRGSNNGSGPGDLFVDIAADGPGKPNGPYPGGSAQTGIGAPTITGSPTSESVSGTAVQNADVRVYRTQAADGANPNDLTALVGKTTANGSGNWTLTCPSAGCTSEMPGSGRVTANQTDAGNNSSEFSPAAAYTAVIPDTSITSSPAEGSTINDATPTFGFSSNESSVSFQCKIDGGAFAGCAASHTSSALSDGAHTLQVRAVDTAGNQDPTPASRTFTVDVPPPPDTTAPDTTIVNGPKKTIKTK